MFNLRAFALTFAFSGLTTVLTALPLHAGELNDWSFDSAQNQFRFSVDRRIQPQAMMIFNPTRIVIDLPGTDTRKRVNEQLSGNIRSVRISQFDQQTTRIVIELAPGYTMNPEQVKVRGLNRSDWVVEMPQPQREVAGQ